MLSFPLPHCDNLHVKMHGRTLTPTECYVIILQLYKKEILPLSKLLLKKKYIIVKKKSQKTSNDGSLWYVW